MKRQAKVFIIIGLILVSIAICVWSVNRFILPVKIKGFITNLLKERTGHEVTIGGINYLPLSRFYLKDITLYDKERPKKVLLNIEGLSFNLQLWPFLKEKSINARLGLKDFTCGRIKLNGVTSLSLKRRVPLVHRPFLKNLDGAIILKDFSFATNALPSEIENITGRILLKDDLMRLEKSSFKYNDIIYNLECNLADFDTEEPKATLSLDSDILKTTGKITLKDDYIKIEKIEGVLLDSKFNIMGDIKGLPFPILNLYSEASINLADLKKVLSKSNYISDSLKPAGLCKAVLFFNGRMNQFNKSEGSIRLSSDKVSLHGLTLDDLYLDLRMKDGIAKTHRFDMKPYQGLLNGSLVLDLNKEGLPYSISFALKDADLEKFSADMKLARGNMGGFISSKFFLKGNLTSPDTLRGSGWINVVDGRLWDWPLLGGVVDLFGMPHLSSITFKEAAGNFIVDQRRISTEDLTFYSEKVNITTVGFVDFDGRIDLLMNTHIIQDLIEGSSDAARTANMFISQAGNYMGKIKVTGTLKEPKYKIYATPIKDAFKGEIEGFLKDILR